MNPQTFANLKESQLSMIELLNSYRIRLTQQYALHDGQLSSEYMENLLLNLQIQLYDNHCNFDLKDLETQNMENLTLLLTQLENNNEKKPNDENQLFDVDWEEDQEKSSVSNYNYNKNQLVQKKNQQMVQPTQPDRPNNILPKKNMFFGSAPQSENLSKSSIIAAENMFEPQKKTAVDFISAKVLPKTTSVRKKFVPPFKKPQIQTIYESENQQQGKCKDPKYKGLDQHLVKTIQSQILETAKSVKWEDIAGLQFAKKLINEMIVWPMLRPDIFSGLRAPPRGILLFGPPGTGKTMIGRAIASSASATFFNISASSLTSKWVGESQKLVRTLFQIARIKQPSVIFIDEIDSLLCARSQGQQQSSRRVKTQFLVELDGAKTNQSQRILIIGATNLPQQLDDAVRRRFVKRLYIPLPNFEGRVQLISRLTVKGESTFNLNQSDINELSKMCEGFSGADIYSLCQEASMAPLRSMQSIETIRHSEVPAANLSHFKQAMKFVRPSVSKSALSKYQDWNEQFGSYQFNSDQIQH